MARAGRAGTPLPLPARREGADGVAPRGGPRRGGAGAWGLGRGVGGGGGRRLPQRKKETPFTRVKFGGLGQKLRWVLGGREVVGPKRMGPEKRSPEKKETPLSRVIRGLGNCKLVLLRGTLTHELPTEWREKPQEDSFASASFGGCT